MNGLSETATGTTAEGCSEWRAEVSVTETLRRLADPDGPGRDVTMDLFAERAVARARRLDRLAPSEHGPLHGLPFLAKGNMAVAGVPNAGVGPYSGWTAAGDAAAIALLEDLGAVLVGRSRFTELALASSEAEVDGGYRCVANPWDARRTVGGSSSGAAAAVAHGLVPLALGSDTGGSVRIPGAFAGVVGIKPTDGRMPRDGMLPVSWTLDQVGVLGKDIEIVRRALGFPPPSEPSSGRIGRRVGLVRDVSQHHPRSHPLVRSMLDGARTRLERIGDTVIDIDLPAFLTCQPALSTIVSFEGSRSHGPARGMADGPFGAFVTTRMDNGAAMTESQYLEALAARSRYRRELLEVFAEVDALVLATIPFPAPTVEEVTDLGSADHAALTRLANLAGVPAVTVPAAWTAEGLPLGCQVMAPHDADALTLDVAEVLLVARAGSVAT